jgi:hypothetical protein
LASVNGKVQKVRIDANIADRCTVLALALRAAEQGNFGCSIESGVRGGQCLGLTDVRERNRQLLEMEKYRGCNLPSSFVANSDRSKWPL